jgi:hypothetical protein
MGGGMESADDYIGLVVQLNAGWRVVECRDGIQWILQRRGSPKKSRRNDWRGRSYCRTSEALIRCTREYIGPLDPAVMAILKELPEWIEPIEPTPKHDRSAKSENAGAQSRE